VEEQKSKDSFYNISSKKADPVPLLSVRAPSSVNKKPRVGTTPFLKSKESILAEHAMSGQWEPVAPPHIFTTNMANTTSEEPEFLISEKPTPTTSTTSSTSNIIEREPIKIEFKKRSITQPNPRNK